MKQYIEFIGNHRALFMALAGVIVFIAFNEFRLRKTGRALTAGQAVRMINDEDVVMIDIRDAGDYQAGHALGARNIPTARLGEQIGTVVSKKDRPVILYCKSGNQSVAACRTLERAGYFRVYSLKGGLYGWQDAQLPIEK